MSAVVRCTSCGKPVRVPEGVNSGYVRCPLCKNIFPVGTEEAPVPAPVPAPRQEAPVLDLSLELPPRSDDGAGLPVLPAVEDSPPEHEQLSIEDELLPPVSVPEREDSASYALLEPEDEGEIPVPVKRKPSPVRPPSRRSAGRRRQEPLAPLEPLQGRGDEGPWSRGLLLLSLAPLGILLVTLLAHGSGRVSLGAALALGLGLSLPLSLMCVAVAWKGWGTLSQNGRTVVASLAVAGGYLLALLVIVIVGDNGAKDSRQAARPPTSASTTQPGQPAQPAQPEKPPRVPPPATEVPGLIAYWPFDEGRGTTAFDPRTGQAGTLMGATWAPGVRGRALRLNGTAFFDYGDSTRFNFPDGGPFTFAGWVQTTRRTGTVLSQRNRGRGAPVIDLFVADGLFRVDVRDDRSETAAPAQLSGQRNISDGAWHHFALSRERFGAVSLYVDGVLQQRKIAAFATGAITTNLRALGMERYWAQGPQGPNYLEGCIDEFCVFGRALTDAEVRLLAGRGP
jgi:hypothetical protein